MVEGSLPPTAAPAGIGEADHLNSIEALLRERFGVLEQKLDELRSTVDKVGYAPAAGTNGFASKSHHHHARAEMLDPSILRPSPRPGPVAAPLEPPVMLEVPQVSRRDGSKGRHRRQAPISVPGSVPDDDGSPRASMPPLPVVMSVKDGRSTVLEGGVGNRISGSIGLRTPDRWPLPPEVPLSLGQDPIPWQPRASTREAAQQTEEGNHLGPPAPTSPPRRRTENESHSDTSPSQRPSSVSKRSVSPPLPPAPRPTRPMASTSRTSEPPPRTSPIINRSSTGVLLRKVQRGQEVFQFTVLENAWRFLEDPSSSLAAVCYARASTAVVVLAAATTLLQSIEDPLLSDFLAAIFEVSFEVLVTIEFLVRFIVSPNHIYFFRNPYNLIDLFVWLPLVLRAWVGFVADQDSDPVVWYLLFCVAPTVRLLKTLRHFDTFKLVVRAFALASEALPALLFTLAVITLSFAAAIYAVEPRANIPTLGRAIWLVIVTTTTVGYGDTLPETTAGTILCSALIIFSVLYFAIPIGMVGHAFTTVWSDRDRVLLMWNTRERLLEWGYTAADIRSLFRHFDSQGVGELNFSEFKKMVRHMGIRLSPERCLRLFELFDDDNSGVVDDKEFVRHMYPEVHARTTVNTLARPSEISSYEH